MRKVQIGIVGLGRMGKYHAEDVVFRMEEADLTAVCCRNEERAVKMKKELGAEFAFSSYEEMLQCKEVEAVLICSASLAHHRQVKQAIEAGKHVFCEKPLGFHVSQCQEIQEVMMEHEDIIVQIGFMSRYDSAYRQAFQLISKGEIGKPIFFRSYRMDSSKYIQSSIDFADRSGGLYFDVAVHDFDLARWLLQDEIESVYALGGCYGYKEFEKYSDCDNGIVTIGFESGAMGLIFSGRTSAHGFHVETEIIGTDGSIQIGPREGQRDVYLFNKNGMHQFFEGWFTDRFADAFLMEKKVFVKSILENKRAEVSVMEALLAARASVAAHQSYIQKEKVSIL